MIDRIEEMAKRALAELAVIQAENLEGWRLKYLGRNGELNGLMRSIGKLPTEDRPSAGQAANLMRSQLETTFELRCAELTDKQDQESSLDVTMSGHTAMLGSLHPVTATLREVRTIFSRLGFRSVVSPEVEWDEYNFEKLNIPQDHPARDMWDTFFLNSDDVPGSMLLRTHTSPAQARVMEQVDPPIRVIAAGRCFRYEDVDASHESMFHQVEGLVVDENITMADLRGTLQYFVRSMFGADREVRIRGSFFPFTEPSCEVDMTCLFCNSEGCRVCGRTGWIEMLGAGMVHPVVLEMAGYDSRRYSGFAFGMGLDRIVMLRHGIDDIRHLFRNDLRFLQQFV